MARRVGLLFILLSSLIFSDGGSNYSAFGIGDIQNNPISGFRGMAGTSVATPSDYLINLSNPAMWTQQLQTSVQLGYQFNQSIVGVNGTNILQTNSSPNAFNISFVVDTSNGISVGTGLYKYTNVSFNTAQDVQEEFEGIPINAFNTQFGTGGLNRAYIGASVRVFRNLSLGAKLNYSFGNINQENETNYFQNDPTDPFTVSQLDKKQLIRSFITGSSVRLGAYYQLKKFGIGTFYETAADLDTENEVRNLDLGLIIPLRPDQLSDPQDSTITDNRIVNLPSSFGIGINYKFKKYLLAADYVTQDFSNFDLRNINGRAEFSPMTRLSLGAEKFGSTRSGASLFEKTTFRAGLAYQNLYYSFDDQQINDIHVSFGFTTPITNSSHVDYSLQIGSRGIETDLLVQETYFKMNFNIRISEEWFRPFRRNYDDLDE